MHTLGDPNIHMDDATRGDEFMVRYIVYAKTPVLCHASQTTLDFL